MGDDEEYDGSEEEDLEDVYYEIKHLIETANCSDG